MYLSPSNLKVDCPTWSLPARETCKPGELDCKRYCYAVKAERVWKCSEKSRQSNYEASLQPGFVEQLKGLVKITRQKTIRVHESGDFYSREYIEKWYAVARLCPDVIFYAYTKRDDLFRPYMMQHKPANLILIYSWDGVRAGWYWKGEFRTQEFFDRQDAVMRGKGFANCIYVVDMDGNCPAQTEEGTKCTKPCRECMKTYNKEAIMVVKH